MDSFKATKGLFIILPACIFTFNTAEAAKVVADMTIYGKINLGIVSYDNDTSGDNGVAVFDEASRLGFRGDLNLRKDLKLIWKMEGTVSMEDSASYTFNRDRYVGLKGGWGQVRLGEYNTAYKNATGAYDLFADRWGDITGSGTHGAADRREANQIGYDGKFRMVNFGVTMNFSESADNPGTPNGNETANGYTFGLNVPFAKVYEIAAGQAVAGGAAGNAEGDKATKIGFKWNGKPVMVNAIWEQFKDVSAATDDTWQVITVQGGYKVAAHRMLALSYTSSNPDGNDNNCTQTTLGYLHTLNKQTEFNVIYSSINNDNNIGCIGRFGSGNDYASSSNGANPSGLAAGFQYNF